MRKYLFTSLLITLLVIPILIVVGTSLALPLLALAQGDDVVPPQTRDGGGVTAEESLAAAKSKGNRPSIAYTMKQRQVFTPAGGTPAQRTITERHQRADGVFKIVRTDYNADGISVRRTSEGFGIAGSGFFDVDAERKRLVFLQPLDGNGITEEAVREDECFHREDSVAGQSTLVLRDGGADETSYRETHYAPALGNLIVKIVTVNSRGEEVTEATEITHGEPDPKLFKELAQYEVSYAAAEERIRQAERAGRRTQAARLRGKLERARKK